MPRGRRTERISERDVEVLEFIARYGVVPRDALALWAGTKRTVTQTRERRLHLAGLIELRPRFGELGPFAIATRAGLRACSRGDLRPARFSYAEAAHSAAAALIGAQLERQGRRVISEREILAEERARNKRVYSAKLAAARHHRPDLVALDGGPEAIEVELTRKGATRLDGLLRSWRRAVIEGRLGRVTYRCAPVTLAQLNRAVSRLQATAQIHVEPL